MIPNTSIHWHYEVFVMKGVLLHIHSYAWGYLLAPLDLGDPINTIEILFKKYPASANRLYL